MYGGCCTKRLAGLRARPRQGASEKSLKFHRSTHPFRSRKEIREPLENRSGCQTLQLDGIELIPAKETGSDEARQGASEGRLVG